MFAFGELIDRAADAPFTGGIEIDVIVVTGEQAAGANFGPPRGQIGADGVVHVVPVDEREVETGVCEAARGLW